MLCASFFLGGVNDYTLATAGSAPAIVALYIGYYIYAPLCLLQSSFCSRNIIL